jgi:hypothetical protein
MAISFYFVSFVVAVNVTSYFALSWWVAVFCSRTLSALRSRAGFEAGAVVAQGELVVFVFVASLTFFIEALSSFICSIIVPRPATVSWQNVFLNILIILIMLEISPMTSVLTFTAAGVLIFWELSFSWASQSILIALLKAARFTALRSPFSPSEDSSVFVHDCKRGVARLNQSH